VTLLSEKEKQTLNAYHKWVREKLSPRFEGETREWLLEATREI
jgi:Xaa-Pro aminopeptidase